MRRRTLPASLAIASATLLFLMSGGMQSFAQPSQNGEASTVNISGTVMNSVTHEPIGHALVYTSDGVYAVFTDDHGHFELSTPETHMGSAAQSSNGSVIVSGSGGQTYVK